MVHPPWHALPIDDVLVRLETPADGLSDDEAERRRRQFGANELPPPPGPSPLRILLQQFAGVVVWLLLVATAVSVALGDLVEATAIAAVLVINTAIGFTMEWRARTAMHALLQERASVAVVIRRGHLRVVDARELVPGDIIDLVAGRQVPADARLLQTLELRVNEAALTGESVPASKHADQRLEEATALADRANMIFSGTMPITGTARAVVTATGPATEVGRIGELIAGLTVQPTPLDRQLESLGKRLVWLSLLVAAAIVGLEAAHGADLLLVVQTGIALAVAAVPEALPVVATIALAVGMRRMASRQALVRRLATVESLGSTTVICTDKTRTLTSGEMSVVRTWSATRASHLLETAALATAFAIDGLRRTHDPVDAAVLSAAESSDIALERLRLTRTPAGAIPFSSERKLMATFHLDGDTLHAAVKGAPTHVLARCRPQDNVHAQARRINEEMAGNGLRVLAVATGRVDAATDDALTNLELVGLLGLADPPAAGVKETIARLRAAGLRTVMLTGDQSLTARAVAHEIGMLPRSSATVDGPQLDAMSDGALFDAVGGVSVFSRITPEHKLRIVGALQRRGEIVAMLGDGINDAPALRKADVGVAMGVRGTDAAKEAAGIVLADDRFDTIAAAVEEGRVVFDNIQKFVLYLFSCNLAEVLLLFAAGVAGLPLPLVPLQLLSLNLITDTLPALALAVEPADPDIMNRPPRSPGEALLSRAFVIRISGYASLIAAAAMAAFAWALENREQAAQTMAFMTLALAQIAHLGNARSTGPVLTPSRALANLSAVGAVCIATLLQLATLSIAPLAQVLRVVPLEPREWLVVVALAAMPAVAGQAFKIVRAQVV